MVNPQLSQSWNAPKLLPASKEIIKVTDGVMVARGDLGVEMSPALVPSVQKEIIKKSNNYGKFVITATQMLNR